MPPVCLEIQNVLCVWSWPFYIVQSGTVFGAAMGVHNGAVEFCQRSGDISREKNSGFRKVTQRKEVIKQLR